MREVAASGRAGAEGVAAWVAARGEAAGRVARTIEAAAGSGFTLSKLVVAASLLGDLARA